jgi:hypothetical protein
MGLLHDYDERVSGGYESGDVASPELDRDMGRSGPIGGDREPIRRTEGALEPAILAGDHQIYADPDRVEPVRVFGSNRARNGVGWSGRIVRPHAVAVDREGELWRAGPRTLLDAGGERQCAQQRQRP